MPLTPEDVHRWQFGTTRWWKFQTGYDEDEVDDFLDRAEEALMDRDAEIAALRGGRPEQVYPAPGPDRREPDYEPQAPARGAPAEPDEVTATVSVLAMAKQTADQAVSAARRKAEDLVSQARREAGQITSDAQALAARLERGLEEQRDTALGSLVEQRDELERQINELRELEHAHRARLRAYLDQPSPVDAGPGAIGDPTVRLAVPVTAASPGATSRNGSLAAGHGVPAEPGDPGPAGPATHGDRDPGSGPRGHGTRAPDRDPGDGPAEA